MVFKVGDSVTLRGVSHGIERIAPGTVVFVVPAGTDHREAYKALYPDNKPRLVSGGGRPRGEVSYLIVAEESDTKNDVVRWPRVKDVSPRDK